MSKPAKKQSLSQKEPEDYSADEKEAAQAVINNANAATLTANKKTLADAIKSNSKNQQDYIDSFRSLSSDEVGALEKKEAKVNEDSITAEETKSKKAGADKMKKAIEEAKKIDEGHTKKREDAAKAAKANVRKEPAALAQKNPEDFSADEKEAA